LEEIQFERNLFDVEEYKEDNKDKNLLGTIIVFMLVDKDYILQLDYKEELIDYIENIHNYWPRKKLAYKL